MAQPPQDLNISLLKNLSSQDAARVFEQAVLRTFSEDAIIIQEGDPGKDLFIVSSGQVRVEKATLDRKQEVLSTLGPGECFGELSLVDREPRSATVRATGSVDVFVLTGEKLEDLFQTFPEIHRRILQNLVQITSRRLRQLDQTLIESVYDSILQIDRECRVLEWKQITSGRGLLEGPVMPERTLGRDLLDVVPRLGEGVRQKLLRAMASADVTTFPLEYENTAGETAYFEVTAAPCEEGAVVGLRDRTDTRMLEMRLIQAEKLAMAGQMSAEIGHEMNNYLAVIVGHTDLLLVNQEVMQQARAGRSVNAISEQLNRMTRFVSGLMDLGMLKSRTEQSNLNLLVDNLVHFIQGQSRFRRVEFVLDLTPKLPGIEVDPGQIQQVLLNLYANAADAMEQGRVVTTTRFSDDEGLITVIVADNGPGMPEDIRRRIFDAGFTTKPTGHGFGLAVCHRIVENHNGNIAVESAPGQGTTFTLTFRV